MIDCDVLIVGGGPAGSTCAWKLVQAGMNVIVLDKHPFPRQKVCAGWITPQILSELEITAEDYAKIGTIQPITRFITGLIDGPEIETDYRRVVSYGIRRFEFDHYLLQRSNATLCLGEVFQSLHAGSRRWIVNEKYSAKVVIGAGGHFCPVARWLKGHICGNGVTRAVYDESQSVVVAQELECEMSLSQQQHCSVLADRPELYFCHDCQGYGWVFRKGNFLNIGLGRDDEADLFVHVRDFVRSLVKQNKIPADLSDRFHGHAYRLRTELPAVSQNSNILLIGDAAGLADQHSGEGIRPAVESGLIAARSMIDATLDRPHELGILYQDRLREWFKVPSPSKSLQWIPPQVQQRGARYLMRSRWFARQVLLDRWFLHQSQKPLPG